MRTQIFLFTLVIALNSFAIDYDFHKGIRYRGASGDAYTDSLCYLDIASPRGKENADVLVWYHGGGLTGGNSTLPEPFLTDSIVLVSVEYRKIPIVPVDSIIDDTAVSVAWVFENIENYGGNPKRIFLSGHSAGGYLIDMVGLDKRPLAKYGIDADAISGLAPVSAQKITHYAIRELEGIPPLQPIVDEYAPLFHIRKDCPPMLIVSGDREKELYGRYEEQAYFKRMMDLIGHPDCTLYELDGYDHGGMVVPAMPLVLRFMHEH